MSQQVVALEPPPPPKETGGSVARVGDGTTQTSSVTVSTKRERETATNTDDRFGTAFAALVRSPRLDGDGGAASSSSVHRVTKTFTSTHSSSNVAMGASRSEQASGGPKEETNGGEGAAGESDALPPTPDAETKFQASPSYAGTADSPNDDARSKTVVNADREAAQLSPLTGHAPPRPSKEDILSRAFAALVGSTPGTGGDSSAVRQKDNPVYVALRPKSRGTYEAEYAGNAAQLQNYLLATRPADKSAGSVVRDSSGGDDDDDEEWEWIEDTPDFLLMEVRKSLMVNRFRCLSSLRTHLPGSPECFSV